MPEAMHSQPILKFQAPINLTISRIWVYYHCQSNTNLIAPRSSGLLRDLGSADVTLNICASDFIIQKKNLNPTHDLFCSMILFYLQFFWCLYWYSKAMVSLYDIIWGATWVILDTRRHINLEGQFVWKRSFS